MRRPRHTKQERQAIIDLTLTSGRPIAEIVVSCWMTLRARALNEGLDVFTDIGPVAILIEGEANHNQGRLSILN